MSYLKGIVSRLRAIFANLKKILFNRIVVFLLIILAFFGITLIAVMPAPGSFIILTRDIVGQQSGQAKIAAREGLGLANQRIELANVIRAKFDPEFVANNDLQESFGASRVSDIVSAAGKVEAKEGPFSLTLGVDFSALVQRLADKFLAESSSILIIDFFSPDDPAKIGLTSYRVATRTIQASQEGAQDLQSRIATFIIDYMLEYNKDCNYYLCGKHLPNTEEDLLRVAKLLDTMNVRASALLCENIHFVTECLVKMREEVDAMAENSPIKEFLLLLLELMNLQTAIQQSGSTDKIGNALNAIGVQLARVRQAPYFASVMQEDGGIQRVLASSGLADLDLSKNFIETAEFYLQGRVAMQSGRPAEALELFEKVKDPPAWFESYLTGVSLLQDFDLERSDLTESLAFLERLQGTAMEPAYIKHSLIGVMVTGIAERMLEELTNDDRQRLLKLAEDSWRKAIELAPASYDRVAADVERVRTLYAFGASEQNLREIDDVIVDLQGREGDANYRMAFFSAAALLARMDRAEDSLELLETSIRLFPQNLCAVDKSEDFDTIRKSMGLKFSRWLSALREEVKPTC